MPTPPEPNAQQILAALTDAGFVVYQEEPGQYARMRWPATIAGPVPAVVVSLDATHQPQHDRSLQQVRRDLGYAARAGAVAQQVLDQLNTRQEV